MDGWGTAEVVGVVYMTWGSGVVQRVAAEREDGGGSEVEGAGNAGGGGDRGEEEEREVKDRNTKMVETG